MEKINEFEISMVCYNKYNKYTLEEINDMLIEWAESKDIYLGGSVKPCVPKESSNDFLNNKYPTNPKLGMSDVKVSIPYIICAAIWFKDGNKYGHQPRNVDSGLVVCGRRHHNCFLTAFELNGGKRIEGLNERTVRGFLTSDDRFIDREDGGQIAFDAGQTDKLKDCLFSEDLY